MNPGIATFLHFLESVAREASEPIFGIKVQTTLSEKGNKQQQQRSKQSKSFVTETPAKPVEKPPDTNKRETVVCPLCNKDQPLYTCIEFKRNRSDLNSPVIKGYVTAVLNLLST